MIKDIENVFFEELIATNKTSSVYLKNGIRLIGKILGADSGCILLTSDKFERQLVLKHNIASVLPHE